MTGFAHLAHVARGRALAAAALLALAAAAGAVTAARAQSGDAVPVAPGGLPQDLAIPINLLCTTCDDFIRCTRDGAAPPAPGARVPETVYRLREKTFWAQIATIGDYLMQLFRAKTTDERPFSVYHDDGTTRRVEDGGDARATIDAAAALISLPGAAIDQRSGTWTDARGVPIGRCVAIKRREGYAMVREMLGRPIASSSESAGGHAP